MKDWGGELLRDDRRWRFGRPPANNANFAWVQHMIYHLAPTGFAGFVLANGSMSSKQSGEGEIRKAIVEADLVDCMVALPGQLFYSTQIPACLWFIAHDKKRGRGLEGQPLRDRRGEVLFIDARQMGRMVDRTHRELTWEDIRKIADTYHNWRGDGPACRDGSCEGGSETRPYTRSYARPYITDPYEDIPGFCKSATLEEIRKHGHVLTPGRYVGVPPSEEDTEPFEEKMTRLVAELRQQQAEARRLNEAIWKNLEALGYER